MPAGEPTAMNPVSVVFFQRKPYPFHKSLEFIFQDVRARLPRNIRSETIVFRHYSRGILNRIRIAWEAYQNQGEVNHVTGDIHFATLLLPRKKTVLTVLDCGILATTSGLKKELLRLFWFSLPAKKAAWITVISGSTKKDLLNYIKYDPERILVIPVAISSAYTYHAKEFNKLKPVLLQIGTTPNKNLNRLVQAVQGISCELRIVGKLADETKSLLDQSGISYSNFTDLSEQQLVEQYRTCDLVTFVSTFEGFGMPIIEANATGRAVITSNLLSMPEVAGDAAHLVDPYKADEIREGIQQLIRDDDYRNALIRKGLSNCKRFDPAIITNQYAELYRTIRHASGNQ